MSVDFNYQNFNKKNGFLAICLCFSVLAVTNLLDPPTERPTDGRWGWLFGQIWDWFGMYGAFYYWTFLSIVCFVFFLRIKK